MGTARRLKEHDPQIQVIAVQPEDSFHGLEGLKHLPTAIVPGIWDAGLPDEVWGAPTEASYALARRLARSEGSGRGTEIIVRVPARCAQGDNA